MGEAKEIIANQMGYGTPCIEGDYQSDYPQAFELVDQSQNPSTVTTENQGASETLVAVA